MLRLDLHPEPCLSLRVRPLSPCMRWAHTLFLLFVHSLLLIASLTSCMPALCTLTLHTSHTFTHSLCRCPHLSLLSHNSVVLLIVLSFACSPLCYCSLLMLLIFTIQDKSAENARVWSSEWEFVHTQGALSPVWVYNTGVSQACALLGKLILKYMYLNTHWLRHKCFLWTSFWRASSILLFRWLLCTFFCHIFSSFLLPLLRVIRRLGRCFRHRCWRGGSRVSKWRSRFTEWRWYGTAETKHPQHRNSFNSMSKHGWQCFQRVKLITMLYTTQLQDKTLWICISSFFPQQPLTVAQYSNQQKDWSKTEVNAAMHKQFWSQYLAVVLLARRTGAIRRRPSLVRDSCCCFTVSCCMATAKPDTSQHDHSVPKLLVYGNSTYLKNELCATRQQMQPFHSTATRRLNTGKVLVQEYQHGVTQKQGATMAVMF